MNNVFRVTTIAVLVVVLMTTVCEARVVRLGNDLHDEDTKKKKEKKKDSSSSSSSSSAATTFVIREAGGMPSVQFSWKELKKGDESVHFSVSIRHDDETENSSPNVGWIGFGVADPTTGMMVGADVALIEHLKPSPSSVPSIRDTWTSHRAAPVQDPPDSQNWILERVEQNTTHVQVDFARSLTTGLNLQYDRPIVNDSLLGKYIIAWGESQVVAPHLVSHRTFFKVNLFSGLDEEDYFHRRISAKNVRKSIRSWTMSNLHSDTDSNMSPPYDADDLFPMTNKKDGKPEGASTTETASGTAAHIIGLQMQLSKGTAHHWTMIGTSRVNGAAVTLSAGAQHHDTQFIVSPEGTGTPVNRGLNYVIEAHVRADQLGLTATFTIYWVLATDGLDGFTATQNLLLGPAQPGIKLLDGDCTLTITYDSECTRKHLSQPLTVFQEILHGHSHRVSSAAMFFRPVDNNSGQLKLFDTASIEYPDYAVMGLHMRKKPLTLLPGDYINVSCRYFSRKDEPPLVIGPRPEDEMCMYFGVFYPASGYSQNPFSALNLCRRFAVERGHPAFLDRREERRTSASTLQPPSSSIATAPPPPTTTAPQASVLSQEEPTSASPIMLTKAPRPPPTSSPHPTTRSKGGQPKGEATIKANTNTTTTPAATVHQQHPKDCDPAVVLPQANSNSGSSVAPYLIGAAVALAVVGLCMGVTLIIMKMMREKRRRQKAMPTTTIGGFQRQPRDDNDEDDEEDAKELKEVRSRCTAATASAGDHSTTEEEEEDDE